MNNSSATVTSIILAAGQSKRMGQAKLLLPWGAHTILDHTIQHVRASSVDQILLISGGYREAVEQIAARHRIPVAYNPAYATGEMLSSLKLAVTHITEQKKHVGRQGVLVMLGDLPFISPEIISAVADAFRQDESCELVAPVFDHRRGHPVLIGQGLWTQLLALPATGAPRDLIRKNRTLLKLVPVMSDVIHRDIDTPDEYQKWRPTATS